MTQKTTHTAPRRRARRSNWLWSRTHFLLRLLGLTGVLAMCVGLVLARSVPGFYDSWQQAHQIVHDTVHSSIPGHGPVPPLDTTRIAVYLLVGGALAVLPVLLIELLLIVGFVAARRSLLGFNAVVQIALAAVLLVGINVFAFWNPVRLDFTRDREFTLPAKIKDDLKHLKGETTIVVYQAHKSLTSSEEKKRDAYDQAAELQIGEMVSDLVQQFRELGPQFQVITLDSEDLQFADKLKAITEDQKQPRPKLREAIDAATENTIFFYRDGHVQQLAFEEFFQLDKVASKEGRGNLVLLGQGGGSSGRGVEAFAEKIINVEQRRPRIGILVVHEALTTEGSLSDYSLKGLRSTLTARGFEVRDVVLKKWPGQSPVADTLDESKLAIVEAQLDRLERDIADLDDSVNSLKKLLADWTSNPNEDQARKLERLQAKYQGRVQVGSILVAIGTVSPEIQRRMVQLIQGQLDEYQAYLDETRSEQQDKQKERARLDSEVVAEGRRMSDINTKLRHALSECDLLFIPRITRMELEGGIPQRLQKIDNQQVAAIKEFLKSGHPVFACLGPINEPPDPEALRPPALDRDDNLEALFAELGIRLGGQTVLFKVDAKEFADRGENSFTSTITDKVPTIDFETPTQQGASRGVLTESAHANRANPLRDSLRVTSRSVGGDFDLRIRFPRPVYYDPLPQWFPATETASSMGLLASPLNAGPLLAAAQLPRCTRTDVSFQATGYDDASQPWMLPATVASTTGMLSGVGLNGPWPALANFPRVRTDPIFLLSDTGWNDANPYATRTRRPRFVAPKPDDPDKGTLEEKRRGPFSVGVAVETPLPLGWTGGQRQLARIVVIGQGNVFTGLKPLKPAEERLLLQSVNWLLDRDESLPTAAHPWHYPRIEMTQTESDLWLWGCRVGMPVALAFLGVVVLLIRRLR
jgi:hypothetical protein